MRSLTPADLKAMCADGEELAILDLREELIFSRAHLLHARSLPLSRLELRMARLVPRRTTRVVLCDDNDGLAERAAQVLRRHGYDNLFVLAGGVAAWAKAGFELFSGVHVPSKGFGEFIEHDSGTPSIPAEELERLMREGTNLVVLDSRPLEEYARMSIPGAINVPGAELVLRVRDLAPSPDTLVVVNCAGRTRSIIGAQSLIEADVPNKVVALRNGTMGWNLAGFDCETGKSRRAPAPSVAGAAWAKAAADQVASRFGVARIDRATLDRFRSEQDRTLYLFDVRDPSEYVAGHVAGALSAPGGQLVQATDQYVGTLGARIVLVDDKEVRALMTASWLRRMGWKDVFVLVESGTETGLPENPVLGADPAPELRIDVDKLADLLAQSRATVIDLSLSRNYKAAHIPGAWFAIRARLAQAIERIPLQGTLVLTSEDGVLAGLAAPEARALKQIPVRYLAGGNAAWRKAGHSLTSEHERMADEAIDIWLRPYELPDAPKSAMVDYLTWETDLLPRLKRDGYLDLLRAGRT
ncbi:MAG TPA: rhodanese-like domain-containing protein [Xanthobacteraceae bacterium]|nr:rhodanese-like domain-containing protein [Xanthobacteraceae bacterium]